MTTRIVNADDYADAVDEMMRRFDVDGRGVRFEIWRKDGGVFVGIDTQPPDSDMKFIRDRLIERFGVKVQAAILEGGAGRHAFLFYPAYRLASSDSNTKQHALPAPSDMDADQKRLSSASSKLNTRRSDDVHTSRAQRNTLHTLSRRRYSDDDYSDAYARTHPDIPG